MILKKAIIYEKRNFTYRTNFSLDYRKLMNIEKLLYCFFSSLWQIWHNADRVCFCLAHEKVDFNEAKQKLQS